MENKNVFKWLAVIIVLAVIVAVVVVIKNNKIKSGPGNQQAGNQNNTTKAPSRFATTNVDESQLPPRIPTDLPIEKGAAVTQNEDITDSQTSQHQSNRTYITTKSIKDNFADYKKYLADNGWTTSATLDQPDYKNITATKSGDTINIIFNYHSGTDKNFISIYYTYTPPPSN